MTQKRCLLLVLGSLFFLLFPPAPKAAATPLRLTAGTPVGSHTFAPFNTETIVGGGAVFSVALDVSSLPDTEYLFYNVTADFVPGTPPNDAWSSTLLMGLNDGGTTLYKPITGASAGVLPGAGATTLIWTGQMIKQYPGGTNLTINFQDNFTDLSIPYTSELHNVSVTIYPGPIPGHSFTPFNTGLITGGGSVVNVALDVSSLPNANYLFYNITADFVPTNETPPDDAWSSTLLMGLNDGGGTIYRPATGATTGVLPGPGSTTLTWSGQMHRLYPGGTNLTLSFQDTYDDDDGTYTSELQNVAISIYLAPTPSHTFATFSTGTIIGGGAFFSQSLAVAGLPETEYLFYRVTADFVPGTPPNDAWSNTIHMRFNDGGSTVYQHPTTANIGVLPDGGSTTLTWLGQLISPYPGTTPLTISFWDTFDDASGPYTSELQNVTITLYPATTAPIIRVASDCNGVMPPCVTSLAQAVQDVAVGGQVVVIGSLSDESVTIDKDLTVESNGGLGEISGGADVAAIQVSGGTVFIQNLAISRGASTNAIVISGGQVTVRGNTLEGGGTAAIVRSGGTVTAYANNVINTGGIGISGTISAPKNWWGTAVTSARPSGVAEEDWAVRLGSNILSVAFDEGSVVTLGDAQLLGPGPGTGVIMNLGSGSANAPFGVGVAPYVDQACSDYYDFYSTEGAGWTVLLPINTDLSGCSDNALTARRAFIITDVDQCSTASSTVCWELLPSEQVMTNGNKLAITGLSLSGTHLVAGDSSGGLDPTAVQLNNLTASRVSENKVPLGLLTLLAFMGMGWSWRRRCATGVSG
jgi:hypothetical protein